MRRISLNLLLGAGFALGFAPFNLYFIAWPALGWFYYLFCNLKNPRQALRYMFCFALGFNVAAHSWVYNSISTYGELNLPISIILTIGFLVFLSAIQSCIFAIFHIKLFSKLKSISPTLLFTALWVTFEWLKTTPLICFPWSQLAYSVSASPFKGLLPITGILGTGAILVFFICVLATWIKQKAYKRTIATSFILITLFTSLQFIQWSHPSGKILSFTAIQGNITEFEKWDPNNLPMILQHYGQTTLQYRNQDLIIWPEGSIPMPWQLIAPSMEPILDVIKEQKTSLILGAPEIASSDLLYNTMVIVDKQTQLYRKENLVYFGESLPLRPLLEPIVRWLQTPPPVYTYPISKNKLPHVQNQSFIPLICYDIAFPNTIKQFLPSGKFIVTLSDDAWFGNSFALQQHLQIAITQSIAFARPQIVVTNNGLTALISDKGKVLDKLPAFEKAVLNNEIKAYQGSTIYYHLNDFLFMVFSWIILLIVFLLNSHSLLKR